VDGSLDVDDDVNHEGEQQDEKAQLLRASHDFRNHKDHKDHEDHKGSTPKTFVAFVCFVVPMDFVVR